jgi:hypothetical protein
MNLGYFTNTLLTVVGGQGFTAMNTGVCKIASGLKDPIGLTPSECRILAFWSYHLGTAKVPFLLEHAHTIYNARGGKGPYSKNDLEFIRCTAGAMKHEVATTDKMVAEVCAKHGEILDLAYEMRPKAGMERLLTGREKSQREYPPAGETKAAPPDEPDPLDITDQGVHKITDPKQISTLAGIEMAISRMKGYSERLEAEKLALIMISKHCARSGNSLTRGSIH